MNDSKSGVSSTCTRGDLTGPSLKSDDHDQLFQLFSYSVLVLSKLTMITPWLLVELKEMLEGKVAVALLVTQLRDEGEGDTKRWLVLLRETSRGHRGMQGAIPILPTPVDHLCILTIAM